MTTPSLASQFPFLFAGLSPDEIAVREEYYSHGRRDSTEDIEKLLDDRRPPLSVGDLLFEPIVSMLLSLLRTGSGGEAVAEYAASIIDSARHAAACGETRGEQRAALLFRHPHLISDLHPSGRLSLPKLRRTDRLGAVRFVREFEQLREEMGRLIPGEAKRRRRKAPLFKQLTAAYPELKRVLANPTDVLNLSPERAARVVYGARHQPAMDAKTVGNRLAEARDVVLFLKDAAALFRKVRGNEARRRQAALDATA